MITMTVRAGQALDELIAIKVMGWRLANGMGINTIYPPGLHPASNVLGHTVPAYSTDIAAALTVLEKMRLHVGPYGDLCVGVKTNYYCSSEHDWNEAKVFAVGDTVPLAICFAALKAVGIEAQP